LDLWTFSCQSSARLQARDLHIAQATMVFDVHEGHRSHTLSAGVVGHYNVSNLLGVIAALRSLGLDLAQAVSACARITAVPGRMEWVGGTAEPLVVIDYAHTPDALEHALRALRPVADARGGLLWVVFGCGGDRDRLKRPLMAAVAERAADRLVLTSDNPRSESPQAIVQAMIAGLQQAARAQVELDRASAIEQALQQAQAADVVLVAGKGHEDYQEVLGHRRAFSDRQQAQHALLLRQQRKAVTS